MAGIKCNLGKPLPSAQAFKDNGRFLWGERDENEITSMAVNSIILKNTLTLCLVESITPGSHLFPSPALTVAAAYSQVKAPRADGASGAPGAHTKPALLGARRHHGMAKAKPAPGTKKPCALPASTTPLCEHCKWPSCPKRSKPNNPEPDRPAKQR